MKKTIISALVLMSGVLGFSGCVKNAEEIVDSEIKEYTLISHADAPNTRMNISGDKTTGFSTNWESGDQIGVYAIGGADHNLYTCNYHHTATVDQNGSAKFTGQIRSTNSIDFNLYAYYPYTEGSDYKDLDDQKGVNCKISSTQTMSGVSFDKSCAYMVAKTGLIVNTANQNNDYEVGNWQFRHTVAFINLNTKSISYEGVSGDEIVSTVKFEAVGILENPTLAGDFQFNLEDGIMTFSSKENAITVNVPANTKLSELSAWIVTNPFTMTADDELEITINTDAHEIVKRVSIEKSFEAANVYTLNLAIDDNCQITEIEKPKDVIYELVTDASTLAEGDQVIIASTYKKLSKYYAMGNTQNSNNRAAEVVTIVEGDGVYTITNPSSDVQIFTLQNGTKSGTFAFYTGSGYIYASAGGNHLNTESKISDNSSWKISTNTDTNSDFGTVASIVAQGTNSPNNILYNSNTTPTIFSCYNSVGNTIKAVVIFRLQDDRTPLDALTITKVAPDHNAKSITVTWNDVPNATSYTVSCTGQTDQAVNAGVGTCTFENLEYGEYTVKVTASAEGYRPSSASETCEIINYQLPAPTSVTASGTTTEIKASWNKVDNATSYEWTLYKGTDNSGEKINVSEDAFTLSESADSKQMKLTIIGTFAVGDQYVLYVKSVGDGTTYTDSDEASTTVSFGSTAEPVTVEKNSFSEPSGTLDENVSYSTAKGDGTMAPAINSGEIRLYQNSNGTGGGTITIKAKDGYTLTSVTIGSSMATSIAYTIGDSTTKSRTESLSANDTTIVDNINNQSITFYCMGTSKTTRLYVNYLKATYIAQ